MFYVIVGVEDQEIITSTSDAEQAEAEPLEAEQHLEKGRSKRG